MHQKKYLKNRWEKLLIGVALLLLAGISFWGYYAESQEDPLRVVFNTKGGSIVFEHRMHASPDGFDLACEDCHHDYSPENKGENEMKCRSCHYSKAEEFQEMCSDAAIHKRCIGYNCLNCHSDGAENCGMCHE